MKAFEHVVILTLGKHALPLRSSALRILSTVNISSITLIEKPLANQDFDFYWQGKKDGAEYQVRGDSWDQNEPQRTITVTVIGQGAFMKAKLLAENAAEAGWRVES